MKAAGLAHDHSYDFPVTQTDLGDALGLSVVHINRTRLPDAAAASGRESARVPRRSMNLRAAIAAARWRR